MKSVILSCFLLTCLSIGLHNCTIPEMKSAKFERDSQEVISEIKALGNFQDASIHWGSMSFDGNTTHKLTVELLNGKDLSTNQDSLDVIAKEAMRIVVDAIGNEADYDNLIVEFKQKGGAGLVSTEKTRSFPYKLADFK